MKYDEISIKDIGHAFMGVVTQDQTSSKRKPICIFWNKDNHKLSVEKIRNRDVEENLNSDGTYSGKKFLLLGFYVKACEAELVMTALTKNLATIAATQGGGSCFSNKEKLAKSLTEFTMKVSDEIVSCLKKIGHPLVLTVLKCNSYQFARKQFDKKTGALLQAEPVVSAAPVSVGNPNVSSEDSPLQGNSRSVATKTPATEIVQFTKFQASFFSQPLSSAVENMNAYSSKLQKLGAVARKKARILTEIADRVQLICNQSGYLKDDLLEQVAAVQQCIASQEKELAVYRAPALIVMFFNLFGIDRRSHVTSLRLVNDLGKQLDELKASVVEDTPPQVSAPNITCS